VDDLRWAGAVEQTRLLRDGLVSPAELHAVVVDAIERLDPVIHAVVIPLFERPCGGVPMLLKDAGQELAGTPHWVGVKALRDVLSTSTTTTALAERFETIGFSIVGKGACPPLSAGATTEPPGFEPTRNPWDLTRSAGGSSGGPAAAVASGMVSIAHGSDATGSLRCPAALCGVATLNPTTGRIPSVPPAGQPPNDAWREFVLARHAEDLTAVFTALTGSAAPRSRAQLRVGLLDHDPELGMTVHPACSAAVHVAGALLESLGHAVDIGWPTALDHLWAGSAAAFAVVSDAVRPPTLRWVSERLGRPVVRGELDDAVFDAAARATTRSAEELQEANARIDAVTAPILDWWNDNDILVTPTTFQPAWPLGGNPGPREMGTLLAPFSLTGQPALSLPLHSTDDGLPVGAHIVARPGGDEVLLRLAEDLQAASDWTRRRPPSS
jgi:amidase